MTFLTAMGYYGYGYPRYGFGFYWDPTLILVVIGALISMWASGRVQSTFNRYSRVGSRSGMTGAETARRILDSQGLYDVQIRSVRGNLTDHYDPRTRTVNLSQSVYGSTSVASVGVAAHECGHAVQHAQQYAPLNIRSALVPIANIGTNLSWPIIIIGLLLGMSPFLCLGILLFSLGVLFQLVTLPVEFNASSRAVTLLDRLGILQGEEVDGAKKVLKAAALTYVAAAAGTILQLLRMVILFGGRNNRDNNKGNRRAGDRAGCADGGAGKRCLHPRGALPRPFQISVSGKAGESLYHTGGERNGGTSALHR